MEATPESIQPPAPKTPKEILFTWAYGIFWFSGLYASQLYFIRPSENWLASAAFFAIMPVVPFIAAVVLSWCALAPTLVVLLPLAYYKHCPFSSKIIPAINSASKILVIVLALLVWSLSAGALLAILCIMYLIINLYMVNMIMMGVVLLACIVWLWASFSRKNSDSKLNCYAKPTLRESLFRWSSGIFIFFLSYACQLCYLEYMRGWVYFYFLDTIPIIPGYLAYLTIIDSSPQYISPVLARYLNSWPALFSVASALVLSCIDISLMLVSIAIGWSILALAAELNLGQHHVVGLIGLWIVIQLSVRYQNRYLEKPALKQIDDYQKQGQADLGKVPLLNEFFSRFLDTLSTCFIYGLFILCLLIIADEVPSPEYFNPEAEAEQSAVIAF